MNYYIFSIIDDGRVLKIVNIVNPRKVKAVVISDNAILPNNAAVKQLRIVPGHGRVATIGRDEVRLANLVHCSTRLHCRLVRNYEIKELRK